MSPRAACRLATLGFTRVYDYAAGKVDWLAHGLPVEGSQADQPTAGSLARQDVATCALDSTVGDALDAIAGSPYGFALVVSPGSVLLGRVRRSVLEGRAAHDPIEPVMEPGPSTIRPHETPVELHGRLRSSSARSLVVTRPDGSLIGVVRRDDVPEPQPDTT
jgi:CBS domain-containing protein